MLFSAPTLLAGYITCKNHHRNDLLQVGWGVKLYGTHSIYQDNLSK